MIGLPFPSEGYVLLILYELPSGSIQKCPLEYKTQSSTIARE